MKRLRKRLVEEVAIEDTKESTLASFKKGQCPSSPQVALPTNDSDSHDDITKRHGDDKYVERDLLSEETEPVQENFTQTRINPTHGSYEWPTFQVPTHHMDFLGMLGRFDPRFTHSNNELFGEAQFKVLHSPIPYSPSPPGSK